MILYLAAEGVILTSTVLLFLKKEQYKNKILENLQEKEKAQLKEKGEDGESLGINGESGSGERRAPSACC